MKGGYAVRSLAESSPYTQDVDIVIDKALWRDLDRHDKTGCCVEYVYDVLDQRSQDRFKFEPQGWIQIHDLRVNTASSEAIAPPLRHLRISP